jgi:hypothetical protein
VRSSFRRNFAVLRATYQQSLQGFALQPAHHQQHNIHNHHIHYQHQHHPHPNAIAQEPIQNHSHAVTNNPDDLTEQIRISVQDTHISHGSLANELGGNISDVLDSYDEENILNYGNNQPQQDYVGDSNSTDLVHNSTHNNSQFIHRAGYYVTQATSSSSASSSSSSRADIYTNQSSTSDVLPPRRIVVVDTKDCNNKQTTQPPTSSRTKFSNLIDVKTGDKTETTGPNLKNQSDVDQPEKSGQELTPINELKKTLDSTKNLLEEKQCPPDGSCPLDVVNYDSEKRLDIEDFIPAHTQNHQVGVIKNYLFNGSSFSGYQRSKNESYEVNVKIQHVDYDNSYLCGYLCIAHLTKSHPSLTTFFEGEIISERYPFLTRKWEATEEIDRAHWSKFEDFNEKYSHSFNFDSFDYKALKDSDYIYMRWKEHFLVPDHTIKHVEGASYAGFYYICYSKRTCQIKGYYFHINSEYFER